MNRITYNDIIKAFRDFCDKHYQVAQFVDVEQAEFQPMDSKFPSVVVTPMPSTIGNGSVTLQFAVIFADILIADNSNGRDVYSDTLEILKDFVAWFTNNPDLDWSLTRELSIEPFFEKFDDILAGWILSASVEVPFDHNVCDIPVAIQ